MSYKVSYFIMWSCLLALQLQFQFTSQSPVANNVCQSSECKDAAAKFKETIDPTLDPCDDFFQFVCGNFPKNYPNADVTEPNGTIQMRMTLNTQEISDFLKKKNSDSEPKTIHKIRKFYSLITDKNVFSKGLEPVKEILSECGLSEEPPFNPHSSFDLSYTLAKVYRAIGNGVFFSCGPNANPNEETKNILTLGAPWLINFLGLTEVSELGNGKKYYLSKSEKHRKTLNAMCNGSNSEVCEALRETNDATWDQMYEYFQNYQSNLTEATFEATFTENNTEVYMNLKELQNLTNTIANSQNSVLSPLNWTTYLFTLYEDVDGVSLDFSKPEEIKIYVPSKEFVEIILEFIHSQSVHLHEVYIWFEVVQGLGSYTDYEMATNFGTKNVTFNETEAQELGVQIINYFFSMAVSYYYVETPHYNLTKNEIRDMVVHIKDILKEILINSTWIDDITREKAVKKLELLKSYVVFPTYIESPADLDAYYDYIIVTDNLLESILKTLQKKIEKVLRKLSTVNKLHEDSGQVAPSTVNAFYSPEENTIYIPAGILGAPLYEHSLRALVYGGIGSIVGHEITHGFDNEGSKYNATGQLEDWWEKETLEEYKQKARCFINAYGNYSEVFQNITQKGNSNMTLGEDIADNGGFKESLYAYRRYVAKNGPEPLLPSYEHYTHEQLFTLSFGYLWCENPVKSSLFSSRFNVHSPNGVRVNGVLKNSEEFTKIWNCPKGSNMNPVDKCEVW